MLKMPTTLLVATTVAMLMVSSAHLGTQKSEIQLTSDRMSTLFGGSNNGLCCAIDYACTGRGMTPCPDANPCKGSTGPDTSGRTDWADYCGRSPSPPNPNANCAQYTDTPLGDPVFCLQMRNCVELANGDCTAGPVVANSEVRGTYSCQSNSVCPAGPLPAPDPPAGG